MMNKHGIKSSVCVCPVVSDSVIPQTVARQLPLSISFPGKKTGVGCHFVLQRIFLTQGLNPCLLCLLHWQAYSLTLYQFSSVQSLSCVQPFVTP